MKQEEADELFRKYVSGQLNPEEIRQLRASVSRMEQDALDAQLQTLWNGHVPPSRQNEKAFREVSEQLKQRVFTKKRHLFSLPSLRIVAAVLLLLLLSTTMYLVFENRAYTSLAKQTCTMVTEKGERASLTLPDGSKVFLNTQTSLTYPAAFGLRNRTVRLSGEACFEVSRDENHPFIVQTFGPEVKVLGTIFNLYACSDDEWFEASLVQGKVEVIFPDVPEKKVVLTPGRKVRYNTATREMSVSATDLRFETAWRRGDLIFRSSALPHVMKKLESFYGVRIQAEGVVPGALFTGSFHEEDISLVLINLQQHYNFAFTKFGSEVRIKFKQQ